VLIGQARVFRARALASYEAALAKQPPNREKGPVLKESEYLNMTSFEVEDAARAAAGRWHLGDTYDLNAPSWEDIEGTRINLDVRGRALTELNLLHAWYHSYVTETSRDGVAMVLARLVTAAPSLADSDDKLVSWGTPRCMRPVSDEALTFMDDLHAASFSPPLTYALISKDDDDSKDDDASKDDAEDVSPKASSQVSARPYDFVGRLWRAYDGSGSFGAALAFDYRSGEVSDLFTDVSDNEGENDGPDSDAD
jgi:hypothetical protein